MLAGELSVTDSVAQARWERRQEQADEANLKKLKATPPHQAIVFILLALFEMVKIGGLYALATPSTKGRTPAQRKSDKRRAQIAEAKANAEYEARIAAFLSLIHISEPTRPERISYAVFCLKKKK